MSLVEWLGLRRQTWVSADHVFRPPYPRAVYRGREGGISLYADELYPRVIHSTRSVHTDWTIADVEDFTPAGFAILNDAASDRVFNRKRGAGDGR